MAKQFNAQTRQWEGTRGIEDLRESDGTVDAITKLALQTAPVEALTPGAVYLATRADGGHVVIDLLTRDDHLPAPARKVGRVQLDDADSFIRHVKAHQTEQTVLYAGRPETGRVTAVFNDHATAGPGWGDFGAVVLLRLTPEWAHWAHLDGKFVDQVTFAEHLEAGELEIVDPPAAALMELTRSFQAHSKVAFKAGVLLESGQRQLVYEETVEASSGPTKGTIVIPKEFHLAVMAYEGGTAREALVARLRYRLREGQLTLGYVLVRPQKALEAAFNEVVKLVSEGVGLPVLRGTPPAGATPNTGSVSTPEG